MLYDSPLDPTQVDHLVSLLPLQEAATVIDIGCGQGELLLQVLETYGCHGMGLDPDAYAIGSLQAAAQGRGLAQKLDLHEKKASDLVWPEDGIDALLCVGSVHAFGDLEGTLAMAKQQLRPGGVLLVGDIIWRQPPTGAYLDFLGKEGWPPFDRNLGAFANVGEEAGLRLLYATEAPTTAWDAFEGEIHLDRLQAAKEVEDAALREEKIQHAQDWYRAYVQWGRATMSFGLGLFERI